MSIQRYQTIPRECPVGRRANLQVSFKRDIASGQLYEFVVTAMAVQDKDVPKATSRERPQEVTDYAVIRIRTQRKGATEGQMMVRATERQNWSYQHWKLGSNNSGSLFREVLDCVKIGADHQVWAMLFGGSYGKNNQSGRSKFPQLLSCVVGEEKAFLSHETQSSEKAAEHVRCNPRNVLIHQQARDVVNGAHGEYFSA